jgi:hypothetical protein
MRAKEFTVEAAVTPYQAENLQLEKAMELLNAHCTEALPMLENPIWRSMKDHQEPLVFIDTTNSERKSQNTSNHYTLLMDNSPNYALWPKRSKSLIATSDRTYANAFGGSLYALFPFNGTRIGICPEKDIWEVKAHLPEFEPNIHTTFEGIADMCRNYLYLPDTSYAEFVKAVKMPRVEKELRYLSNGKVGSEDFIDVLNRGMAPDRTGMQIKTIKSFALNHPMKNEVWFSGKCIAIEKSLWKRFVDSKNGVKEPKPVSPPGGAKVSASDLKGAGLPAEPPGGW